MTIRGLYVLCLACCAVCLASCARSASFSPRQVPASDARIKSLRLPAGFAVNVFARGVSDARMIAVGPSGVVYVTQPQRNRVTALWDSNHDGRAEAQRAVVSGISYPHGITIHANKLYLAAPTRVYVADLQADGTVSMPRLLFNGLPPGGRHPNRTLAFGPDGLLYLSVGSSCNACAEDRPEYASLLRMRADGSARRIFARGLRNTIGFDWHPTTHVLWGMDQGSDDRGANVPPEELNRLEDGRHYGWPWCYGKRVVDTLTPGNPPGMTIAQFAATTAPAVLEYQAHSSPIQLLFYTGASFPATYRHDAFLTFHGSWNRRPSVGYKVVRVRFNAQGEPTGFEDFLTGFLANNGQAQFARPCGLAQLGDGSLLIGDDSQGVIYRVSYRGR
ncbi:MAG TPA: PQQ-dependent sugar dehydrogenase [Armatimonadota bacterium]|jgi:glucose/arabinose dehydrogenase